MKHFYFEEVTINQFMKCWFNEDYTEISKENFDELYVYYIDASGVSITEEFEKVSYIHFISNRINSIKIAIRLQKEFLAEFNIPFLNQLEFFKPFGHNLLWKGNSSLIFDEVAVDDFLKQILRIESKEKKYELRLEECIKELKDYREEKSKGLVNYTLKESRIRFIKMLNMLSKNGYKIDRERVGSLEELAIMIVQNNEEAEALKNQK